MRARLQQTFLAQYSTDEAPVKMREVAGYVVDTLSANAAAAAMAAAVVPAAAAACAGLVSEAAAMMPLLLLQQQQRTKVVAAPGRIDTDLDTPGSDLNPVRSDLDLLAAAREAVAKAAEVAVQLTVYSALEAGAGVCEKLIASRAEQVRGGFPF